MKSDCDREGENSEHKWRLRQAVRAENKIANDSDGEYERVQTQARVSESGTVNAEANDS